MTLEEIGGELGAAILQAIQAAIDPLVARIQQLEKELDEWVDTETAVRLTGRSEDTLLRERRRPGTLIKFGKDGRKNLYQRSSLVAYTEAKTVHYHGQSRLQSNQPPN